MKVGFDHQIFSIQKYGGISRYFVELINHLADQNDTDLDLSICCPLYRNAYLKKLRRSVHLYGAKTPNILYTRKVLRSLNSLLVPTLLEVLKPDVIHETYYTSKAVGPKQAKRVITVYDMIHELFPDHFPKGDRTTEYKKLAIERADHIICISNNTRNDVINLLNVNPNKVSVIYLGHDSQGTKSKASATPNKPYLLYVGVRDSYKNFNRLIKAYAVNKRVNSEYNFVAFGGGAMTRQECNLIQELGLSEKVIWTSGDDALLTTYYQHASLFVYPSLYEGFGIPPLEAMSSGCVVACSSTSSIPEVVGDSVFYFDPYSVNSMSVSIENALSDVNLRNSAIEEGYKRVSMFSWEKCARETHRVYGG
ncbi:MAG: glycosyltransferase family 4 protein [Oceanospirillaceae bacterium]|nr:glycosyltransferase family 4 protein [Oceanospirillaceae bacterium]